MKKNLLIVGSIVLGSIAMISCNTKKDWTCVCTASGSGTSISQEYVILDQTKEDAEKSCTQFNNSVVGVVLSCALD